MTRKVIKPVSVILVICMFLFSDPFPAALAAIIGTEAILNLAKSPETRENAKTILTRKKIQTALIANGLEPWEAKVCAASLTENDIAALDSIMGQLPAGGGFFETFLIIGFLVFLILLVTDLTGATDVYPFVKKHAAKKTIQKETSIETREGNDIQPSLEASEITPSEHVTIYFNPDSNELSQKAIETLNRVANYMVANSEARIRIKGFPDSTDSSPYNKMVSEIRANTAKNYLIGKGVNPSKISTRGFGAPDKIANTKNEEKNQLKGRVEIELNY
jgi:outer membrane protein OmpA-like peptidoglycan-associated protein